MKLRIVSDGTVEGTRVVDERGRRVQNVMAVNWTIGLGGIGTAVIAIKDVPVDLKSNVVQFIPAKKDQAK